MWAGIQIKEKNKQIRLYDIKTISILVHRDTVDANSKMSYDISDFVWASPLIFPPDTKPHAHAQVFSFFHILSVELHPLPKHICIVNRSVRLEEENHTE